MTLCVPSILAQGEADHFPQIVTISLLLIGLLIVGFVAVLFVKRRLRTPDDLGGVIGFTLSDLRQMRKSGQLSDEEFERAKGKLVDASRKAAERELSRQTGGDLALARHRAAEGSRQESADAPEDSEER